MSKKRKIDRTGALSLGVLALFLIAAFSQAKLQIIDRAATLERARATQRFEMTRVEYARRGAILSADGKPLASDEDAYELALNFPKTPQSDAFFMNLSAASGIPASEFSELAASGLKSRRWKQPMSPEQAKAISRVKNEWRADGLSLVRIAHRTYPLADMASAVVGGIREGKPSSGLELAYDGALAGRDGVTIGLLDRTGSFLPMRVDDASTPKEDGRPILTTIDSSLQELAGQVVQAAVKRNAADSGMAVIMDPKTGDVLAMTSYPTFNPDTPPNVATSEERSSDLNACVQERFEPGSMFKILTLAKAIDAKAITQFDTVYCSGLFTVGKGKPIHCDKHEAHGRVTPEMAIAESCNIAAAHWSLRIGYQDMVAYLKQLGLMKPTKLGLPGEVHGQFREDEPAKQLQLAHVGFGQSITATPIELCSAFTMIANGGVRMQPRMIQKVGRDQNAVHSLGAVVKPESAEFVKHCMEAVIQSDKGTGRDLRIPGFRLAGKTGTAQKIGRGESGHVANFVGFVPADQPKAVVLVMINNPKKNGFYGAQVAGPCFVQLAKGVIRRYGIQPTERIDHKSVVKAPFLRASHGEVKA